VAFQLSDKHLKHFSRNFLIDMKLFTLVLQSYLTAASALECSPWGVGQVVNTTSGSIQGHAASIANTVSEYLGIPYGQPTVGNLRFAAPVEYTGTGLISGANYASPCCS
jgi:hypothetical protein